MRYGGVWTSIKSKQTYIFRNLHVFEFPTRFRAFSAFARGAPLDPNLTTVRITSFPRNLPWRLYGLDDLEYKNTWIHVQPRWSQNIGKTRGLQRSLTSAAFSLPLFFFLLWCRVITADFVLSNFLPVTFIVFILIKWRSAVINSRCCLYQQIECRHLRWLLSIYLHSRFPPRCSMFLVGREQRWTDSTVGFLMRL